MKTKEELIVSFKKLIDKNQPTQIFAELCAEKSIKFHLDQLKELKSWCYENKEFQEGMDSDGGYYENMWFLKIDEIMDRIDRIDKILTNDLE
jgi:hypothetical protein